MSTPWLPEPPDGTPVCGGFDGSVTGDWTALKLETAEGLSFTPRYGPERRPTIWDPAEWGGEIPRQQVRVAVTEIGKRYAVRRLYCDPPYWWTEIDEWSTELTDTDVVRWPTDKQSRMYPALDRVVVDLKTGRLRHDGCPMTATHVANAHKKAMSRDQYILQKPHGADHQKIDVAMAMVLAHEAAADALADGWGRSTSSLTRVTGRTRSY